MLRNSFIFSLIFLITNTLFFGQNVGKIRGFITDSTSNESLAFCNIYLFEQQTGTTSDVNGAFMLSNIPVGENYTLEISYVGYNSKRINVNVLPNKISEVYISLVPAAFELSTIEKVGERVIQKNETNLGLERVDVRQLEALPKGVELDVFRSLQYIPGVQSTSDVTARYYVRGGASNQNLVLLNGVTLYNPYHAMGIFSTIDPELVNSVEFYKTGFPTEFGGRLSSILSVNSKDGNSNNYSAIASSSLLTGKLLLEGPIPNGSFLFTGRKSYSNGILKSFLNDKNVPLDFYDTFFKLTYANNELFKNGKFTIFGFLSSDNVEYSDPSLEDFYWKNNLYGFKWTQFYNAPLYTQLGVSLSEFEGIVDAKESNSLNRENTVQDVSIQFDANYIFDSSDELSLGLGFKSLRAKLFSENLVGANSEYDEFGVNFFLYSKYKFLRYENFGIDIGSRINISGLSKKGNFTFEPRVNLTYRPIRVLALKSSWGIFQQELTTLSNESEVISLFEPWIVTPNYLTPATAIHYSAGFEYNLSSESMLTSEVYYIISHDVPILNELKILDTDPDLLAGNVDSYGLESSLNIPISFVKINLSHTLSWSYKELNNWIYYPKYDIRHSVNLSLEFDLGKGWTTSAVFVYNSGLPFTQISGYFDKFIYEDFYSNPLTESYFRNFTILDDKNLGRLPDYHRIDLNLSKKLQLWNLKFTFDLNVINAYDRNNIFYFKRDTGERVNMLPFLPSASLKVEI
ncbi:MAG: TonB-dependent receptor [Ignavibacteriales bacterium]|nr:TonB-dependent receptor [Ignavibacteriales bacterium]MCB9260033.1 TonB-dependent receptor [Ignavibacteriales bacterium]